MRIGDALTSLVIRSIIFCFVLAAFAPASRRAPTASFSRASLGFAASVVVTVMLMIAFGAAVPHPAADASALGLRGTI